jgi:hypothetical protein
VCGQAGVADRCVFVTADFMALPDAFSFAQAERTAKADGGGEDHADEEPPGFDLLYDCQCFHVLRKEVGEQPVVDKMAKLVRQGGKLLLHLDSSTTCLADDRVASHTHHRTRTHRDTVHAGGQLQRGDDGT